MVKRRSSNGRTRRTGSSGSSRERSTSRRTSSTSGGAERVLQYIRATSRLSRQDAFILQHGQPWFWRPDSTVEQMMEKMCFRNSFVLASKDRTLTYVEGYAWMGVIPVYHAWCVTPDGRVVDPTWPDEEVPEREYFGVPFSLEFVFSVFRKAKVASVIDNYAARWPVLQPDFVYDTAEHRRLLVGHD